MARSRIMSRRDLEFLLYEWLDTASLPARERYADHGRETFDAVLELSERLATDVFAPINRLVDTDEPRMDDDGTVVLPAEVATALAAYTASGLPTSVFDAELGGMQLPFVVHAAASTWFQAACVGAFAYPFLAEGNASLLVAHGTPEQVATYAVPVIEGRWYGTMALSEPQAGSSLGDITTRAVRQDDGSYRLTGTKMWISGGDHELGENIVHLVLARTPDAPAGTKGISLFIVPKWLVGDDGSLTERNDVALVGLNHKMGYRGTTNTLLNLGEGVHTPGGGAGAVGHLVGAEGQGLTAMFHMMNEARISVGAGAMALGYTGYLHALQYAEERTQGRPVGDKDPASAPVRLVDHPDVRRMLLAQKSYAEGALALVLYCGRLVDEVATGATRGGAGGGRRRARDAHPDREVVALAVVPGGQRPRDPGARRLRLHPRPPRRAVLPRQPAQPDPRGHPRHPGARPARPQGHHRRRPRAGPARRPDPRHGRARARGRRRRRGVRRRAAGAASTSCCG